MASKRIGLKPKNILTSFGYTIEEDGEIRVSPTQLAVVSLENTYQGGVLRIHGDPENFFYEGDEILNTNIDLFAFPTKVSSRYVYFESRDDSFKVSSKEFTENILHAFLEYEKLVSRDLAG